MTQQNPSSRAGRAEALCRVSTGWMDRYWDEHAGLLWYPSDFVAASSGTSDGVPSGARHAVRESAWYAVGLLMRGGTGDLKRAIATLEIVLRHQFNEPGTHYHGTFARFHEERKLDPATAEMFRDFDPNWREFIGTTLAVIRDRFSHVLPAELVAGIDRSVTMAVEGETDRIPAKYSNIAMMKAWLDVWFGTRFNRPEWRAAGEARAEAIYALFRPHATLWEYNSPTYWGIVLSALRLWRQSESAILRSHGTEIEEALWRDTALYYHAGLRNICGPYDRSYGMDMTHYVAIIGEWIAVETGMEAAPLPDVDKFFEQRHDLCMAPLNVLLAGELPADVLPHLHAFQKPRQVERIIEAPPDGPRRVATAWLEEKLMYGGEAGNPSVWEQIHAATMHWFTPTGKIGWMRLRPQTPLDAVASAGLLRITVHPTGKPSMITFDLNAADATAENIKPHVWRLPGLSVKVETGAAWGGVVVDNEILRVSYEHHDPNTVTHMDLHPEGA